MGELLERKDLDVIYVATPVSLHAEHVLAALKTGRPVYGEKAMGFTPEECKAIYAAATRARRALPDWPPVPLFAVDPGGDARVKAGDWRSDARLRVLE